MSKNINKMINNMLNNIISKITITGKITDKKILGKILQKINYNSINYKFIAVIFVLFFNLLILKNVYGVENSEDLKLESGAAVVIDYDTKRVLFNKNMNDKRKMASLTKIMTCILLVENCDMDEKIVVPKEATLIGGSKVGLKASDSLSAKALLYGMLLPSGNDCAYTAAIHIGGTISNFADMMTKKAYELGLNDTSFANPHGLDNDNHYTSAYSMAIIARYALNNKFINDAVNTNNITINFGSFTKELNNTNALLRTYNKADGVKTGFTNGANRCLVASATDNDRRYIAVILGAPTSAVRFKEAKEILEYCFNKYFTTDISKYLTFYINIPVIKGKTNYYEKIFKDTKSIPLKNDEYDKIYVVQDIPECIYAPQAIGTKIGNIKVMLENEVLYDKYIYIESNILKKTPMDYFNECFKDMFKAQYSII